MARLHAKLSQARNEIHAHLGILCTYSLHCLKACSDAATHLGESIPRDVFVLATAWALWLTHGVRVEMLIRQDREGGVVMDVRFIR